MGAAVRAGERWTGVRLMADSGQLRNGGFGAGGRKERTSASSAELTALTLCIVNDVASRRVHDQVHILLIPARFNREVPAYLKWGNSNACTAADYYVATLRWRHDCWVADPIGIALEGGAAHASALKRAALIFGGDGLESLPLSGKRAGVHLIGMVPLDKDGCEDAVDTETSRSEKNGQPKASRGSSYG